jgi:hypothetical protein
MLHGHQPVICLLGKLEHEKLCDQFDRIKFRPFQSPFILSVTQHQAQAATVNCQNWWVSCNLHKLNGLADYDHFGRILAGEPHSADNLKTRGLPKSDLTSTRVGLKYPKFLAV